MKMQAFIFYCNYSVQFQTHYFNPSKVIYIYTHQKLLKSMLYLLTIYGENTLTQFIKLGF